MPESLENISTLRSLRLGNNSFTGAIPEWDGLSLTNLELFDNELSGEIPAFIGNMSSLILLQLHGNNLTGPIPANFTIANLPNVTRVYLHNNNLDRNSSHEAV